MYCQALDARVYAIRRNKTVEGALRQKPVSRCGTVLLLSRPGRSEREYHITDLKLCVHPERKSEDHLAQCELTF